MASNIEVGEGGHKVQLSDLEKYAFFAYGLPSGHVFQDQDPERRAAGNQCYADPQDVAAAVQQFTNPDVASSKAANASALGKKLKPKTPPPSTVTVTVLNGNGVAGAALNAAYLLAQRGYQDPAAAEWARAECAGAVVPHDHLLGSGAGGSKARATALQNLMQPADVTKLPRRPGLLALDPGSMLLVVLGRRFHGSIAPAPQANAPPRPADVRARTTGSGARPPEPLAHKVPFQLDGADGARAQLVPRHPARRQAGPPLLRSTGKPRRCGWSSDRRQRVLGHRGDRLGRRARSTDQSFRHDLGGREFDLYYTGSHLHMVVLQAHGASYWVVNTLSTICPTRRCSRSPRA